MCDFQEYFSRMKVIFQDFPGIEIFKKKSFQEDFPGGVGTLVKVKLP